MFESALKEYFTCDFKNLFVINDRVDSGITSLCNQVCIYRKEKKLHLTALEMLLLECKVHLYRLGATLLCVSITAIHCMYKSMPILSKQCLGR